MSEEDRIKVTTCINGNDAPSLGEWLPGVNVRTLSKEAVQEVGVQMREMLCKALLKAIDKRDIDIIVSEASSDTLVRAIVSLMPKDFNIGGQKDNPVLVLTEKEKEVYDKLKKGADEKTIQSPEPTD